MNIQSFIIINGKDYLLPCLLSHRPLDTVILMLGTNDLKAYFNLPPASIAFGVRQLVWTIRSIFPKTETDVLVVSPPVARSGIEVWSGLFDETSIKKSHQLATAYEEVARYEDCHFLDANQFAEFPEKDGIHLDAQGQKILGESIANLLK